MCCTTERRDDLGDKEKYLRRKEKCKKDGLCMACGRKKDREGFYCTACKEKHNKRKKEDTEWMWKNHICSSCKAEKVYGDNRTCDNCRLKSAERRKKYDDENKAKYRKMSIERGKRMRKKRQEKGVCTVCEKRKPEESLKTCRICLNKSAEYHRLKYAEKKAALGQ